MIDGLTINYLRFTIRFMIRHDLRYDTGYGYMYDAMYNSRFTILIDLDSKPNLPKTQEQYTNPMTVSNNILSTFQQ